MFSRFCHLLSDIASDCLNSAIKHNKNKDKDNVLQTYCKVLQSITKYFNILESITNYYKVLQSVTKYYKDKSIACTWTTFWACSLYDAAWPSLDHLKRDQECTIWRGETNSPSGWPGRVVHITSDCQGHSCCCYPLEDGNFSFFNAMAQILSQI